VTTALPIGNPPPSGTTKEKWPRPLLAERLRSGLTASRFPLVVLGAGVSAEVVPLLSQLGSWFRRELKLIEDDIPANEGWLISHATAISESRASRREAAEFFSVLQRPGEPFEKLWTKFSAGFVQGLDVPGKFFPGVASPDVTPTPAHHALAKLATIGRTHLVSLNFDGLTRKALRESAGWGVALHTDQELRGYFAANSNKLVPAVIKVRGDVFYSRCMTAGCPHSRTEHPLDSSLHLMLVCSNRRCPRRTDSFSVYMVRGCPDHG
jgi:hypothetical protein